MVPLRDMPNPLRTSLRACPQLHIGMSSATPVQTVSHVAAGVLLPQELHIASKFNFLCDFILGDNVPPTFSGVTFAQLAPTMRNEPLWVGEEWRKLGMWCMGISWGSACWYLCQGPGQGSFHRHGEG